MATILRRATVPNHAQLTILILGWSFDLKTPIGCFECLVAEQSRSTGTKVIVVRRVRQVIGKYTNLQRYPRDYPSINGSNTKVVAASRTTTTSGRGFIYLSSTGGRRHPGYALSEG